MRAPASRARWPRDRVQRDPAAQARAFEAQGFDYLHVVDLDGAFAGKPVNGDAVERILEAVSIPVQLGGGIRDMATDRSLARQGRRPRHPRHRRGARSRAREEAARRFPGRIAVGIDARDGKVAVEGWAETSELTALEIARRFEDAGVAAIIYTDIARDGVLQGLNLEATIALAEAISIPVIASGGLASHRRRQGDAGAARAKLEGAIAGRALYDGRLDAARRCADPRRAAAA